MSKAKKRGSFMKETLTIHGGGVYFGDRDEVRDKCANRSGLSVALDNGDYNVFYIPALLLICHKSLSFDDMKDFLVDMFAEENGYIDEISCTFRLPVTRMGRMGHCMTGPWIDSEQSEEDGYYCVADWSVEEKDLPEDAEIERVHHHEPLVFANGCGIVTPAGSEYKYAVTAGKKVIMSTGYEMVLLVESIISKLEEVFDEPAGINIKPAKVDSSSSSSSSSSPAPKQQPKKPEQQKKRKPTSPPTQTKDKPKKRTKKDFESPTPPRRSSRLATGGGAPKME